MALLLGLKAGQTVHIGPIAVKVVKTGRRRIKLSFDGPVDVPIHREDCKSRPDPPPTTSQEPANG